MMVRFNRKLVIRLLLSASTRALGHGDLESYLCISFSLILSLFIILSLVTG